MGNVGQTILFKTSQSGVGEYAWDEAGQYRSIYFRHKRIRQVFKPMVQGGGSVNGLFAEGVRSVKVSEIGQKLAEADVENLLPTPRLICGHQPLHIYPNPASEFFFIDREHTAYEEITLYDMQGRQVLYKQEYQSEDGVTIRELPEGLYLVIARSEGVIFKQKLLVRRE